VIQTLEVAFLVLLGGAIHLSDQRLRRRMALPLGALAMAIGGLRTGPGTGPPLSPEALGGLPAGFRAVTAGFVFLAIIGALVIAIRAGRRGLCLAPGIIITAYATREIVVAAPIGPAFLSAAVIGILAAIGLGIGRVSRLRTWVVDVDRRWLGAPARVSSVIRPGIIVLIAGTLSAALGPHLSLVFAGAAAASWSLWALDRHEGARWPVIPAVLTALLGMTYLFMATVAGDEGLSMGGLGSLPFSPPAETLVAGTLLLGTWLMCGLWPLHRFTPGPLLAPVAILLLVRVALAAAPLGLEHWRPLATPFAVLALWHAGARRWGPGLTVGAAWLSLISVAPPPAGVVAAAWLLSAGIGLELIGEERDGEPRARRWARWLATMAAGWGGLHALEAGLHGEVVYTVLAGAGVALALGGSGQAMTPSAPRTRAPSA
jgi:hypothetical protein